MGLDQVTTAKQSALRALKLDPLNSLGASVLDSINKRLRETAQGQRAVMAQSVSDDFDCALCHCLLFQPVTISCGHSYCKPCLQRAVEHGVEQCPLCRTALHLGILANLPVNIAFDKLLRLSFQAEYAQREQEEQAEQKLRQQAPTSAPIELNAPNTTFQAPIFYLNVAIWPECTFGMHIFEPRYRTLVRDCLSSGSRRFVLGPILNHGDLAPVGTLLEIQQHQSLPDGRSLIQTRAVTRVRIISTQRATDHNAYDVATCLVYSDYAENEEEGGQVDPAELNAMAAQIRQRIQQLETQSVGVRRLLAQCSPVPVAQWNTVQTSWVPNCLFVQLPLGVQLDHLQDRSLKHRLQTLLYLLEQV